MLRLRRYEVFLAAHIVLAILVFVGSWYHIIYRYDQQWGDETWLYVVFAIWGFDRLARLLRTLCNGLRTAVVTHIDNDHVRLDVDGPVAAGHVYLHLFDSWRVWENHPFSVASSVIHLSDEDVTSEEAPTPAAFKEKDSPNINDLEAADSKTQSAVTNSAYRKTPTKPGMVFWRVMGRGLRWWCRSRRG